MNTAFSGLGFGLVGAILLIYLLIVVNFQSWTDPFVIITALPAAYAAIKSKRFNPAPGAKFRAGTA
jgi:multidrug efflux pump subunit AcrB